MEQQVYSSWANVKTKNCPQNKRESDTYARESSNFVQLANVSYFVRSE